MRRLSLDHLTVTDVRPAQLAAIAGEIGCAGICPFLHSMTVLPAMPEYDLTQDSAALKETCRALADAGVSVDLVYPFTLAGKTEVADFERALAAAAVLGAPLANVLCYDRDPSRRIERIGALAELASGYAISLAVEFYPPSQIRSLRDALALVEAVDRTDVGVTLDVLHLIRSGGWPDEIGLLDSPYIRLVQMSDGPASIEQDRIEWEAGLQRLLPGKGSFPLKEFAAAIRPDLTFSVEVPQADGTKRGEPPAARARLATDALRNILREAARVD